MTTTFSKNLSFLTDHILGQLTALPHPVTQVVTTNHKDHKHFLQCPWVGGVGVGNSPFFLCSSWSGHFQGPLILGEIEDSSTSRPGEPYLQHVWAPSDAAFLSSPLNRLRILSAFHICSVFSLEKQSLRRVFKNSFSNWIWWWTPGFLELEEAVSGGS